MKTKLKLLVNALALLALATTNYQLTAHAQGTSFTYQGRVTDNGTNFTGTGQFKFALITSNNNHQATASANLYGNYVTSYNLTYGGSGYVSAPAVHVTGGGGSGATATASISGGVVTAINPGSVGSGSGYTSTPTVTIDPPPTNIIYATYWSNDGTSIAGSEPSATVSVAVTNGLFTVVLGDATLANMAAISAALFAQPNLQLRIWFNDGVSGFAALSPVQSLTSVPYASMANSASNLLGVLPATQLSGLIPASQLSGTVTAAGSFIGALNGDVIGTQSATTVASVGGQTAANIAFGANAANAATSAATPNTIVQRDSTGSFLNGTISLTGNLNLPVPSASAGAIYSGGIRLMHSYGNLNFFAGSGAGNFTMTGMENTAVGFGAMSANGVGDYNTANGYKALASNTSGNENVADGERALYSNTTGSDNTACGDWALYANTNGYENTACGSYALDNLESGGNNIAMGYYAGQNISTNSFNIDIGNAGSATDNGTIRLGTQGTQTSTYIAGIYGAAAGGGYTPVMVNSSGQLATSTTTLVDPADANTGTLRPGITFGAGLTGEGIASTRTTGIGWAGLDFYTGGTLRMRINNNGNVGIGTTNNAYLLQVGSSGSPAYCNGSSWVNGSDRNSKEHFAAINPQNVLTKVSALVITQWKYKAEADGTEHIGPMAQDFHAAFGLNGNDDKHISTVDEGGVALAAIQGLNQKLEEQSAKMKTKEAQIQALQQSVTELKALVEKLATK